MLLCPLLEQSGPLMGMSWLAWTCPDLSNSHLPTPPQQQGPSCESRRCLRRDMLIFQVNWAVLFSLPYSWQQLLCRRSDYSPILGVHDFFCGHDVTNRRHVHDLSGTCLCACLNPWLQPGLLTSKCVMISSHVRLLSQWFKAHKMAQMTAHQKLTVLKDQL